MCLTISIRTLVHNLLWQVCPHISILRHSFPKAFKKYVTANELCSLSRRSTSRSIRSPVLSSWCWVTFTKAFDKLPIWGMPFLQHRYLLLTRTCIRWRSKKHWFIGFYHDWKCWFCIYQCLIWNSLSSGVNHLESWWVFCIFMTIPSSHENHPSMDLRLQAWTHSSLCSKHTSKVLPRLLNIGRKLSLCEACPWKWFRWFHSGRCVFVRVLFDPEHIWPPASHSSLSHMLNEQPNYVRGK